MLGNGVGELKRRETLARQAFSLFFFNLTSFSSPIHSFRSFVCVTDHYNHTGFDGGGMGTF